MAEKKMVDRVKWRFSTDGGATFREQLDADDAWHVGGFYRKATMTREQFAEFSKDFPALLPAPTEPK